MWNGHRMLRHRGHRDELTADLLSKRRDNYPGNFICLPRFLPPSSKYFQSLLDDRLSSSFCFLFVPPSRFFSRLSWLDANILLPILRLSNFRIGFFRFFFFFFFFFFLPLFFFCCSSPLLRWLYLAEGEIVSYDWQLHFSTRASFVANNGGVSFSWKIVGRLEMTGDIPRGCCSC